MNIITYKKIYKLVKKTINDSLLDTNEKDKDKINMNKELKEFLSNKKNEKVIIDKIINGFIKELEHLKIKPTFKHMEKLNTPQGTLSMARLLYGTYKIQILEKQIRSIKPKIKKN